MSEEALEPGEGARNPIAALRRFARPRPPMERCELCAAPIGEEHTHLLEPATRELKCVCEACAILFPGEHMKYRRVPRDIEAWKDFVITDEQWKALGVPIALAFFYYSSPRQHMVTMYPSPGGATEATLAGDVWQLLCDDNPRLGAMKPDVEALLVNRMHGARQYFSAPIDKCFELVGVIRTKWRGLSGGPEVWQEMDRFFQKLASRATEVSTRA